MRLLWPKGETLDSNENFTIFSDYKAMELMAPKPEQKGKPNFNLIKIGREAIDGYLAETAIAGKEAIIEYL
ncbi:hypothetical protein HN832_04925 [archaeon]|jgi:hypothetical protein|nr:hypothetical protein [archaeon]MBT4374031.1 hypothetical protein [archaeon]MBT4532127.1 hypothetical protein [archaeon]MBT7002017.1 hypothetical protein [archaeon]MBT7282728.1 hypothetical protein [archaeon]